MCESLLERGAGVRFSIMMDNTPQPQHNPTHPRSKREQEPVRLNELKKELNAELRNILNYWLKNTPDEINGGFWGKIDNDNQVSPAAPK